MKFSKTLQVIFAGVMLSAAFIGCKNSPTPNSSVATNAIAHGEGILKMQCLTCHGMDMIAAQRLSKIGWTKEVEKMMRWGAEIKDTDKEHLIEFLAANYPVRAFSKEPPPPPAPAPDAAIVARGKTLYEGKCLACHGDDLVKQQRLSKIGWTKEVEKMTRWGAEVNDEEKAAMVEYLLTQNNAPKK